MKIPLARMANHFLIGPETKFKLFEFGDVIPYACSNVITQLALCNKGKVFR